ncbi:uncharacterized protein LOC120000841 isoform X2 [Tripterygium wilfordii]|uniref:uncharacterized protein LOC120000841 isoform X2 n=1 Tax=Tripterygium wilfordii TaxID=458696 RepID=UPI0018F7F9EC|nr:uncharacterized protein LOC120000841 isoform X2 [Tripterygium wilfordii]
MSLLTHYHTLQGGKFFGSLYDVKKQNPFPDRECVVRASAIRRKNLSVKKLSDDEQSRERAALRIHESSSDQRKVLVDGSSAEDDYLRVQEGSAMESVGVPSRNTVLQACIFTSALIGLLGLTIRQLSHVASVEGLPIHDCSMEVQFGFEMWHLELITGLVVLISSSRYLLLRTWPDFAESTEAANQQVLTSLQPLDYIVVAFLPGVGEELLFRGALLPLFGINIVSIAVVAAIFGALHLGSGRKYSFAICKMIVILQG